MLEFFRQNKERTNKVLQDYLEQKKASFAGTPAWGEDVLNRLMPFVANGKMLRSGLVLLAHQAFAGQARSAALQTGAAMELLQSSFLIHDDIMDRDLLRRGEKTINQQYLEMARREGLPAVEHFGNAMAVCAGDIAFFLAFELLNDLPVDGAIRQAVTSLALRETAKVGVGQMQDLYFGFQAEPPSEEEIIQVFLCKTAAYTFILPLLAGAMLAGRQENELAEWRKFGETMGVMFQVRDDDLGMFGEQKQTGKPVGADIRQSKKTLYFLYLSQAGSDAERRRLRTIFGNPDIEDRDVEWVRERIVAHGIRSRLRQKIEQLAAQARRQLQNLQVPAESYRKILEETIDYSLSRNR